EGGAPFQADIRLRDREGHYRWHIVRSVPVRDGSGRVLRRFGTATEIDDRRRAEEALRAGEQRFRFLAEAIPPLVSPRPPAGPAAWGTPPALACWSTWASRPATRCGPPGSRPCIPRTARGPSRPGSDPCARGPSTAASIACAAPTGSIAGSSDMPCRSATTPAGRCAGTAP